MPVLPQARDYDALYRQFRWEIPARYNIGVDCCDRWAAHEPERLAILHVKPDGRTDNVTFGWLRETSNRLANVLRAQGVARGDRVALMLPQTPEVAAAHFAIYKLGAVALPVAILFGPDALAYRLQNSGAKALLTNAQGLAKLEQVRGEVPDADLRARGRRQVGLPICWRAHRPISRRRHRPDDPAMMIYTSGTTGQPKGALHGHRVLLGHLPGAEMPHYPFPAPGDRYWTPADWAWAGGLLDVLLPSLHHGVPVVARRFDKFDPDEAFALMASAGVRNAFIPPTALRMMRAVPSPRGPPRLRACARSPPAASRSASRRWNGARRPSASPSTSSTARPNAIWCSAPARSSACAARLHGQAGARPYRGGDRPRRRGRSRPARSARSRSSGPTR